MTLHDALTAIGWSHAPGKFVGRRYVFDGTGTLVGHLTAGQTWDLLRERGLLGGES